MKTIAIIPARGGSKRIPHKNIKLFNGLPLIIWTLIESFKSFCIDNIYVSTEDLDVKKVVEFFGFNVIMRDVKLAHDETSSDDVLYQTIIDLENLNIEFNYVAFIQCTNPFDDNNDYDKVINDLISSKTFDNSFAATIYKGWLWKTDETEQGIGYNHNKNKRERSQDIKWSLYQERGSIVCFKKNVFKKSKYRLSDKTLIVDIENKPLIDIDQPLDFLMAEQLFREYRRSRRTFSNIKVIFSDFDGVFSDNKVYTTSDNQEIISSNKYDSLILNYIKKKTQLIVITSEKNKNVENRCNKLKLEAFYGVENKKEVIKKYIIDNNLSWNEVAYIGNDYNDIIPTIACGYSFCTFDSPDNLKILADEIIPVNGGSGVIRFIYEKYYNDIF